MKQTCCFLLVFAVTAIAAACNIPVFRYALERWTPDDCQITVFYGAMLTEEQQQVVDLLRARSAANGGPANITLTLVDVADAMPDETRRVWDAMKSQASGRLPYVAIQTASGPERRFVSSHGPLTAQSTALLLDSPARRELTRRLLSGDAIVWLLLKSADEARNQAVRSLLEAQFEQLNRSIELPEGIGEPGSELYAEIPLLLKFSVLELDPRDPRDQHLTRLIEGLRGESVEPADPLLVPVFGRGRALEVIPASQLDAGLIGDLTRFLCGACSCQVKDLNPGFDLLIEERWNDRLFGSGSDAPRPQPTTSGQRRSEPVLVPIPSGRNRSR